MLSTPASAQHPYRTRGAHVLLWLTALVLAAPALGQGNFPIKEADIRAMQLLQYFGPDRKPHGADITWAFEKETFTLKRGTADIPVDLLAQLLPDEVARTNPAEVTGSWALRDGRLVLTKIKAGDKDGRAEVTFSPYKTAPTVVRIGNLPQYVFAVKE